jgi:AraC family transcriptional regulator
VAPRGISVIAAKRDERSQEKKQREARAMSGPDKTRTIVREVATRFCRVQLVSADWQAPIEFEAETAEHYLQLSLLPQPKNGLACFPRLWGPHRFTPMGEMFFYPPGQVLHIRADCRHQEAIACIFTPDAAARYFDGAVEWTSSRLAAGLNIANTAIRNMLLRIAQEMRRPGFASDTYIEMMAGQMLIELTRYLLGIGQTEPGGGLSPWRLKLIDERLRDGGPLPTLSELADHCNLSVRHLTRAFRASRGRSIGDYIAEYRMERAKILLLSGVAVGSVSEEIGFTSANNFSVTFRRMTGESPREFKARRTLGKERSPLAIAH